jgi:hypothetical protein
MALPQERTSIWIEFTEATNYVELYYSWTLSDNWDKIWLIARDSEGVILPGSDAIETPGLNLSWTVDHGESWDIKRVQILGAPFRFVIDDLTYNTAPIPHSAWLLGCGLVCLVALRRRSKN